MSMETLDPRVKITMLLLVSTLGVISGRILTQIALMAYILLFLILLRADMKRAFARLQTALKLIFSLTVLQCVFNRSDEPLLSAFGLTLVTYGGARAALVVSLRLCTLLLSAIVVMSGELRDYLLALNSWHAPYELQFMLLAGLRFLPALGEEARDVVAAVQMRGVNLRSLPVRRRFKVYLDVAMPIVARTIRRSERMSVAMEARAFRAMDKRTSMRRLTMREADRATLIISIAALMLMIILTGV